MTQFQARQAKRKGVHSRIALMGPAGAGKSLTALHLAKGLTRNNKVFAIDTERGSLDNYADAIPGFSFDKLDLDSFSPAMYTDALTWVASQGYDTCVVDSLTHAWRGKDGSLDQVNKAAARSQSSNTYFAWRDVTPLHDRMVETLLTVPMNIIVTMRSKMEYIIEDINGKKAPKKLGLAPVQREDMEYEFSMVADLDMQHNLIVGKTRYRFLDGAVIKNPDYRVGEQIKDWLDGNDPDPIGNAFKLKQIGDLMKTTSKSLKDLEDAGFTNPRSMDAEGLDALILWLKG